MKEGLIKGEDVKSVAGGQARTKSICAIMMRNGAIMSLMTCVSLTRSASKDFDDLIDPIELQTLGIVVV